MIFYIDFYATLCGVERCLRGRGLWLGLVFLCMVQSWTVSAAQERARPNVLLILADDLADWHLGCYGNPHFLTPNIDALAANGTRMANSFVCTPICSPSRATLFTGRVPRQHGIKDFISGREQHDPPQGHYGRDIPPDWEKEVMLSDLLAKAGYYCGHIGKWHMFNDPVPQHSFEYYCSWARDGGEAYRNPDMVFNGEKIEEKGYMTELWTQRAARFMKDQSQKPERPWFLSLCYFNPHTPYDGHPKKNYKQYEKCKFEEHGLEPLAKNALRESDMMKDPKEALKNLRKVAAATSALDDQLPALLKALRESGQLENTLVIFAGDNGFLLGRHGAWSKGYATDPINMYEEVIRVPMIFSWPGKLQGGRVLNEFVSFYDFLPTICEAAGIPPPFNRGLCGKSYWPLLEGRAIPWSNTVYCSFRNTDAIRGERFKYVQRNLGRGPNELFDLQDDPREKTNRINDASLQSVRDGLAQRLNAWIEQTRENGKIHDWETQR